MEDASLTVAIDCRMALHSGVGTVIRALVPRLIALRPSWTFRLIGRPEGWRPALAGPAPVSEVALDAPIYSIAEQFGLRGAARGADVLWSPHYNAGVLAGVPLVTTVHDVTHLAIPDFATSLPKQVYARLMFQAVRQRSAALLFVSQFTRDEFERLVGRVTRPYWIAHNAVDRFWLENGDPGPPPVAGNYLVFVGNLKPHKNLGRLVKAVVQARERHDVRLVIIGRAEGFITGDEATLMLARSLPEAVVFTGEISDPVLRNYLQHARALVFPSLYEGFGLPPLEAMAVGCPVLASDVASMPEVCGDAADYFAPTDVGSIAASIERLLSDPMHAEELRRRGRLRVGEFSWDSTARLVAEALERAAA